MSCKRKKGVSDEERIKREQELFAFVYEHEEELRIEQYEKYHFRVFNKAGKFVDVWPVSRKMWAIWLTRSRIYIKPEEILQVFKEIPKVKII